MKLVCDASAIGSVLLSESVSGLRQSTLEILPTADVQAPVHWPIEIASLLTKAERDRRLTASESKDSLAAALSIIAVATIEARVDVENIWMLAREHGLSAQDAAYLDLAQRLRLPLLTGDKRLARACRAVTVDLPFDPNI